MVSGGAGTGDGAAPGGGRRGRRRAVPGVIGGRPLFRWLDFSPFSFPETERTSLHRGGKFWHPGPALGEKTGAAGRDMRGAAECRDPGDTLSGRVLQDP